MAQESKGGGTGAALPCPERLISDGKTFSVHTYFDVCPESPDGRRVVYSRFTGGVPGRDMSAPRSGVVMVADRNGGSAREVGTFAARAAHTGAYTLWIDNATVAYQDGPTLCLVNVDSGVLRRIKGGCQMFDPVEGALFCPGELYDEGPEALPMGLYRLDLDAGRVSAVITPAGLMAHPFFQSLAPPTELWCHAKWSPRGERVAARVDLRPREKGIGIFSCRRDGTDVIPFRYFSGQRWDKPMHWNWYDDTSFYGYDVTDPRRPCGRWTLEGELIEWLHEGPGNHACLSDSQDYLVTDSWYNVDPRTVMFYRRHDREPVVLAEMPHTWQADAHPALSRDGHRVYFNRTGPEGQGSQVCAVDFDPLLRRRDGAEVRP